MNQKFMDQFIGEFTSDAVYSREEISKMLNRGEISEKRANELLYLCYEVKKGNLVITSKLNRRN